MKKIIIGCAAALVFLFGGVCAAQTAVGIGTTTPDAHAVLDITSTTKGVLFPRLTTAQQATLSGMLGPAEMGMIIIDATTGTQKAWTGASWNTVGATGGLTAAAPLNVTTNNLKINPGTAVGDLLTWDGVNWVNTQPAVQHFSFTVDNHQPYLVNNYVIGLFGIFPSRNTANQPFVGEIYLMGCNFAPQGFATCDGSLINISTNTALFSLLGTQYGGNGINTFALPDLRGRVPVGMGQGAGLSPYVEGQVGGTETKTIAH